MHSTRPAATGVVGRCRSGDYEGALQQYALSLALRPDFVAAYNNSAAAFYKLGRDRDVVAAAGKVLQLDPGNTKGLLRRAVALQRMGRLREALMVSGRCRPFPPINPPPQPLPIPSVHLWHISCVIVLGWCRTYTRARTHMPT